MPETIQTRPKPRFESLSNMIFGLALSVGAITLVGNPPQTTGQLYADIASFGFSFIIVIQVWMKYSRIMSVLPLETSRTVLLNIILLFCVSVEPFLFHILNSNIEDSVSILYAIDLGALNLILGFFTLTLASEEKNLIAPDLFKEFKKEGIFTFAAAAIFFASILPVFAIPLRYYLWIIPLIILSVRRRLSRKKV
ncbi:MAG TPA: TMEM175 family protein [Nitrososphaerales archaeon]|nr:TMEM175 family protein [Nitrososphaerales archaeon]